MAVSQYRLLEGTFEALFFSNQLYMLQKNYIATENLLTFYLPEVKIHVCMAQLSLHAFLVEMLPLQVEMSSWSLVHRRNKITI